MKKKKHAKNLIFGIILFSMVGFAACGSGITGKVEPTATPTPTSIPTPTVMLVPTGAITQVPEDTPVPTETPTPINTTTPTATPVPTNTATPTMTPTPTNTPTPTVTPVPTTSEELVSLMEKAERMAAGYDYIGAIELLKGYEGYAEISEVTQMIEEFTELDGKLVSLTTSQLKTVPHVFFHSLIVDTARAFDNDDSSDGYNQYFTTIEEFNKMMQQMYDKGYVLVSPYDIAYEVTDETGTHMELGEIRLPEGKKPFILSQDDVNYYGYMIGSKNGEGNVPAKADSNGDGFATKILIGEDGKLTCEYIDIDGTVSYGAYDIVPLLEQFIEEHPDFSYHGAKGILAVTGYEGVLGYRTKPSYEETIGTEAYQNEVAQAKAVVECLKENGWIFASHSYGHPSYKTIELDRVIADNTKWKNTVAPIIGDTDILIYPYGSDVNTWRPYTFENEKYSYLYGDGYRYFFNVDGNAGWTQITTHSFRGGRVNLDGLRMWKYPESVEIFFDVESVYDTSRPAMVE